MDEYFGNEVKWGLAACAIPFVALLLLFPPLFFVVIIAVPAVSLFGWLFRDVFSFLTGVGGNRPPALLTEINATVQRELAATRELQAEAAQVLRQAHAGAENDPDRENTAP